MTRGLALNNPMNLMSFPSITWAGEIKPTADPMGRLCQFDTMLNGLRAGLKNLKDQQIIHGLNTWNEVVTRYAPPSENDTQAYVDAMCQGTHVGPDDVFDLTDPDFLALSGNAIVLHEQGSNPIDADTMTQAVNEALA